MEGHQTAIMSMYLLICMYAIFFFIDLSSGNMMAAEICNERKPFSEKVFEIASKNLYEMGISVISYTLKTISVSGYELEGNLDEEIVKTKQNIEQSRRE